jgi:hypothetical protein
MVGIRRLGRLYLVFACNILLRRCDGMMGLVLDSCCRMADKSRLGISPRKLDIARRSQLLFFRRNKI